jgi:sulfur carrier protein
MTAADNAVSRVTVNGELVDLSELSTVADVVAAWCTSSRGVAVARNSEVVPRSQWAVELIAPGDAIEILTAAAGG